MDELYDRDFVLWTEEQAAALRRAEAAHTNLPLDWENLAEEIESLGKSQPRELASQVRRVLRHLLKLAVSPAEVPRSGWRASIIDACDEIEQVLEQSPSLRRRIATIVERQRGVAGRLAAADLEEHGELTPAARDRINRMNFTAEQILDDWFPGEPAEGT